MAIKGAFTFAEMVARLIRGYTKATGRQPDNLAKLKINMEAAERIKQQNVVTEFPKDRITSFYKQRPEKGEVTPIKKFLDDDVATAQINKLKMDFDFSDRNKVLQLLDDIDSGKAFGAFDDVQKKELRDMISTMYTRKPDFASGGLARVGFADGSGDLFGIPMEDIKKYKEKKKVDRTPPFAIPDNWLEKFLRRFGLSKFMITNDVPIYLASILEYLCLEILENAFTYTKNNKKVRITIRDVELSIRNDSEFDEFFLKNNIMFLGGGSLPYIHPKLLEKNFPRFYNR